MPGLNIYVAAAFVAALASAGAAAWNRSPERAGWRLYALVYVLCAVEGLLVRWSFASTAAAGLKLGLVLWAGGACLVEAARLCEGSAPPPGVRKRLYWLAAVPAISML